ncbi:MAG TPA: glycosyl hydrolase, partial [Planctomycetes bacterium]|nr:glycosyl hydrolase [Planctomycetota bacterium]
MRIAALALLVVLAGDDALRAAEAGALVLRPATVDQFYVEPDAPARLEWSVPGGQTPAALAYRICDLWGRQEAAGEAAVAGGVVALDVTLRRGYHEIEFPAAERRFGIVALPPAGDAADPFFAIDSALSWLVADEGVREGLVKALRRSGIRMSRERVRWGQVNPAKDRWQWDEGGRYDTLRQCYARHGVSILEMFHDAPAHLGRSGRYPVDLIGAAEGVQRIVRQWQATWGALEIWNEPEISFGGEYPADQYVSLLKALLCGAERERLSVPVVAGVFAHYLEEYVTCAARNGILQCADAISFHTYDRAERMEALVGSYRSWLERSGREGLPLWLTECGRPWRRGPDRPPLDQDRESALDITMKAVEAKACGIARYFAFVYPFYEENANNFGMACRAGTPLGCMAAYAQAAAAL